jgi:CPA2 family monovalent cation:H+ antiporter-2
MNEHIDFAAFQEILIVLGAVTLVIPIFHRIKVSPVLGFLLIGMMIGPTGLGGLIGSVPGLDWIVITDPERIGVVAEFGIVFLMFMIGLELSFERLRLMRRLVFGLGPLQLVLCAAVIAGIAVLLGQARLDAIVLGLALAMSSTAVIIQVLSEEKRMNSSVGRTSFAILLFQDIAVVPVLFAVAVLAEGASSGGLPSFAAALAQAAIAIVVVIAAGRLLLRPLFRGVARSGSPELFLAACLLVLLGASLATAAAGMSMAMGALLAGLLLAETEYRRQIEVLIEPFKGLLLGVFLISMGMTIDLSAIARMPLLIFGLCIGLLAIKGSLTWALSRLFQASPSTALQTGLLIGPGGEFSFIVLSGAATLGVLSTPVAEIGLIVAALTMATIPLLSALGKALGKRMIPSRIIDGALHLPDNLGDEPRVIIAGYGRVGQVAADMLTRHKIDYIAIDSNPDVVERARKDGAPVYYGDSTNPDFLHKCGLATAHALVVTMDYAVGTELVVAVARKERADLIIVARARDARHAARLYAKGATDAVPETVEASLLLSETLLVDLGVPMGPVIASIHDRRAEFRSEIQKLAPDADVRPGPTRLRRNAVRPDGSPR